MSFRTLLRDRRAPQRCKPPSVDSRAEPRVANNTYRTFVLDLSPYARGIAEEPRREMAKQTYWRRKEQSRRSLLGMGATNTELSAEMYSQMRKRKTFETTVDVEEFGRIQEGLAETQRMQILICEDKGIPVAGLVASAMGDSAIYLLGATSDDGLNSKGRLPPAVDMIKWLKEKGIKLVRPGRHRS